jgi:predicted transcriptional regulator
MEIPPLEEFDTIAEWIRDKRREKNINQTELGDRTGIDNSYISKIESGSTDKVSYKKIRLLVEELRDSPDEKDTPAKDICTEGIEWARPTDKRDDVVRTMTENDFSQLPVKNEDGEHVGSVTETGLIESEGDRVREFVQGKLPEVQPDSPREVVTELVKINPALLVKSDDNYIGIIAKTNLLENPAE